MSHEKKKKHHSMKKDLLAELQNEMSQSGAYTQEITAVVNRQLQEIWNPEYKVPRSKTVRFGLTGQGDEIQLAAEAEVQYDGWTNWYRGTASAPLSWGRFPSREQLDQQIRTLLPQLMEQARDELKSVLPKNAEDVMRSNLRRFQDRMDTLAHDAECAPDMQALVEKNGPVVQAAYEERMTSIKCPQGFHPAHIASLELHCRVPSDSGKCWLEIGMDNGIYTQITASFDILDCCFLADRERMFALLDARIQKCVESLMKRAARVTPLYTCSDLRELPGMTESLQELLQKRFVTLGCVKVQWTSRVMQDAVLLYQPGSDKVRLHREHHAFSECPVAPLPLSLLQQPAVPLAEIATMPQDPVSYFRLAEAMKVAMETAFQGNELPSEPVWLSADSKFQITITWSSLAFQLNPSEKAVGSTAQGIVDRIYQAEANKPKERQAQIQVLNSLNPTELAVLRHIAANGETWYSALADALADQVITTKGYTGACLDRLTELEVPVAGKMMHLLQYRLADGYYGVFRIYDVEAKIEPEVLEKAIARPFSGADVENIKQAQRGPWFTSYLLNAKEKQRWTRFNEALDRMPSTFLASFAKSDEGQAFLKGFTGDDAMFVRLTVEGLPGCKRLAAKLWSEEG